MNNKTIILLNIEKNRQNSTKVHYTPNKLEAK